MEIKVIPAEQAVTFYDSFSGKYFECGMYEFERHVNEFNQLRGDRYEEYVSINTWYEKIGLPGIPGTGEHLYWPSYKEIGWLNMKKHASIHKNIDKPVIEIVYDLMPKYLEDYQIKYYTRNWKGESRC